jgi:hypothetical protein
LCEFCEKFVNLGVAQLRQFRVRRAYPSQSTVDDPLDLIGSDIVPVPAIDLPGNAPRRPLRNLHKGSPTPYTDMRDKLRRFLCWFGFHTVSRARAAWPHKAKCDRCGRAVLMDTRGEWFADPYD